MTHDEICNSFSDDTLLAMKAPKGSKLTPLRFENGKHRLHVKSTEGQVYVALVNKDSESDRPEAVSVKVTPSKDTGSASSTTGSEVESILLENPETLLSLESKISIVTLLSDFM